MTRRPITLREIKQADARYLQRCLPVPTLGTSPAAGQASAAWPPAPGWGTLRRRAWTAAHSQYCPLHWRAAAAAHRRRPRRDEPPSAHGPIQLLCWQATRLPPGRVTRCRRARRARR